MGAITTEQLIGFCKFINSGGQAADFAMVTKVAGLSDKHPQCFTFFEEILVLLESHGPREIADWLKNGRAFAALKTGQPADVVEVDQQMAPKKPTKPRSNAGG